MASRVLLSLALIVIGSGLNVPIVILLGLVTLMIEVVHEAWSRAGVRDVRYTRRLSARRAAFGDEIEMDVEVWNRRRLPLPWLQADDEATPGVTVRERELTDGAEPGTEVLRNAWTLRPWERVVRRFHVGADRRGVFRIGPVDLSVGDPFALLAASDLRPETDTFLVWPRTIPTTEIEPPDQWGGLDLAKSGLAEDPSRFAGVRPYAPGDPIRRIHARTSARLGQPMTKRFEPSREREVLIALDVQTIDGPAWEAGFGSDDVESLYVVAGSLARTLGNRRVAFGLMAAGYTGAETRIASVPVSSAPGQVRAGPRSPRAAVGARIRPVRAPAHDGREDRAAGDDRPRPDRPRPASVRRGPPPVGARGCRRRRHHRGTRGATGGRSGQVARVRGPASDDGPPLADRRAPRGGPMSGVDRAGSGRGSIALVPVALALVAEAAWTSILAGLLQVFVHHDQTAGIPLMLLACVAGVVATRRIGPRTGTQWPTVAAGLAFGVGAIGWLASAEVRSILASSGPGGIGDALAVNPGGWVAAIAFIRGIPYARLPPDPRPIGTALAIGTPGIAVAALVGGMVADPWKGAFLADATVDVVVFLVAGVAALTLSRLTLVGSGAGGVDWRRNPAWVGFAIVLLVAIAALAVATSLVAGPVIVAFFGVAVPLVLVLGLFASLNRRSLRNIALSLAGAIVVGQGLRLLGNGGQLLPNVPPAAVPAPPDSPDVTPLTAGIIGFVVVAAFIGIVVLIRLWMRRPRLATDDLEEERWIDRGEQSEREVARRRRRGIRLGRGRPPDAVAAYRALLDDLEPRQGVRREPGETPAEHAARLRGTGWGTLALDLLAADYGLVRFGATTLSEAEERRGIRRASLLRRRLTGIAAVSGPAAPKEGEARPGDAGTPSEGPGGRSRFRIG